MSFSRDQLNLIASFRKLPPDTSKSNIRNTQSLDSALDKALKKFQIGETSLESTIMEHWRSIVGPQNAHRSVPKSILSGGTLVIHVSNPTVRNELLFNQRQILQKIQSLPNAHSIKQIIFRAG